MTREQIIDAAVKLTATHGLEKWTLRKLAGAVDSYPAVIYYHVGDRETVMNAVVNQITATVPLPPRTMPWREWAQCVLDELCAALAQYPGVARGLSRQLPLGGPLVDELVRTLWDAGFGPESWMASHLLIDATLLAQMKADQQQVNTTEQPADVDDHATDHDYAVARCLDGLAARLETLSRMAS